MIPKLIVRLVPLGLLLVCLLPAKVLAGNDEWKPIDPADLASKESLVEKDADAEAIFWEVRMDNGGDGNPLFTHYVRVKIFNERGKDSQSRIDLPYYGSTTIKDIAARTVKPDGTIVELKKADVFERTIVKFRGLKVRAKSFVLPDVEPGAIVEYRWREVRFWTTANHLEMQFQRDIPVRRITYSLRIQRGSHSMRMHYHQFQMPPNLKVDEVENGFYNFSLTDVPAFHEEPRMPPEDSVRSWILLYYADTALSPERFWTNFGRRINEGTKDEMKVDDQVRSVTSEVIGNARDAQEKLRRIYEYCQTKIRNVDYAASGLTTAEREKVTANKSPNETLKKGIGNGQEIDYLFGAMTAAAGFEPHLAFTGNRQYIFFDQMFADPYFLLRGISLVAIRMGDSWQFFRPSGPYTPFGIVGWRAEGQNALVVGANPVWVRTPISPPEKSLQKRTGKFRLLEDGTLEGDVYVEYSGQFAVDRKLSHADESPDAREKALTEEIKGWLSTADLSLIKIENVLDSIKPFAYSYHIRVPNYAQRTGKRLLLHPNVFTHGRKAIFTASVRRHDIDFRYAWSESDQVTIELPDGFVPDNAESPPPITAEMTQNTCSQQINIGLATGGRTLVYDRRFLFGGRGNILFPVSSYGPLKQLFETLNQADQHQISLKLATASAPK